MATKSKVVNGAVAATQTLPGIAKRVGRPSTGKAKAGATRQREYRARLAQEGRESLAVELPADVMAALRGYVERQNADVALDRMTLAEAVERVLRDRLLRKR